MTFKHAQEEIAAVLISNLMVVLGISKKGAHMIFREAAHLVESHGNADAVYACAEARLRIQDAIKSQIDSQFIKGAGEKD